MDALTRTLTVAALALAATLCGADNRAAAPAGAGFTLADKGQATATIILALDASDSERNAANELTTYLKRVTGAEFAIVEPGAAAGKAVIAVGPGAAKTVAPELDLTKAGPAGLGDDGIVLKAVPPHLILTGAEGAKRGTLYAVYEFLEREVGVRWWTKTVEFVPTNRDLAIPLLDRTYVPKLVFRDPYYMGFYSERCEIFRAHSRTTQGAPAAYGGGNERPGVHTFFAHIPPGRFAEHPEWFGEYDGKRRTDNAQLCLTNEAMRAEVTADILKQMRATPKIPVIDVSQNDNSPMCQCAKCKEVEVREGTTAGPLIEFINKIAAEVAPEFPDLIIQTLAYQSTQTAPRTLRVRDNVMVILCSFDCSRSKPLEDTSDRFNRLFVDDLLAWGRIATNLYVWDYVTNFCAYLYPHPNIHVMAPNIRFLANHGVIGLFNQGDVMTPCGDFQDLRAWLQAQFMWNPQQDEKALISDFLAGYYGPAAPVLQQVLDFYRDTIVKSGKFLSLYENDTSGWLSLEGLNQLTELYEKAMSLAQDAPAATQRVRMTRMGVDLVWLKRYHALKRLATRTGLPFMGPTDPQVACREFLAAATEFKLEWYAEGQGRFSEIAAQLQKTFEPKTPATLPERCAGLPDSDWQDLQDGEFILYNSPASVASVSDAAASDGSAARMPGNHRGWSIQKAISLEAVNDGDWRCFVVAKYELKAGGPTTGDALELGFWKTGWTLGRHPFIMVPIDPAASGIYKAYDLGIAPKSDMMFYAAPAGNSAAVDSVSIDRVFFVREKGAK
jgi:hypothetical protein